MKFSIVVATYNRQEMLQKCVTSILEQAYTNFELLVIDDGSTDDTSKVMSQYLDSRVRYIKLDRNYGTATPARNRGIDEMTGDALIIWDSDDVLLPNALATLHQGFKDHADVGIVCTSTDFYTGDIKNVYPRSSSTHLTPTEWFGGTRPKDAEIIALKKELIGSVRFESRSIDFMFYSKIIGGKKPKIYYVNETCGKVFLESDALSLTKARQKKNITLSIERAPIIDSYLDKYGEWYFAGEVSQKYAGFALGAAIGYIRNRKYDRAKAMLVKANSAHFTWKTKLLEVAMFVPLLRSIVWMLVR